MVFERTNGTDDWTATSLSSDEILRMPEIGIEVPVTELYEGVDLPEAEGDGPRQPVKPDQWRRNS